MRTAVIAVILSVLASQVSAHQLLADKVSKAYPYPVDKMIGIDFFLKNKREDAIFEIFVAKKENGQLVRVPSFSLQRKRFLQHDQLIKETVYVKNDQPFPRELLVCTRTLDQQINSTICVKQTVEDARK